MLENKTMSHPTHLERPEEVAGILELRTNGEDLVYQIFCANDVCFSQFAFNYLVAGNGNSLSVNFGKSSLVDEFPN